MKGSVIAAHEEAGAMKHHREEMKEKRAGGGSYCAEASSRFPHLTDGSNRGVKPPRPEKVGKVMHEYKEGELHSGNKKGPMVKSRDQAVAIAMSEAGMSRKKK